MKFHIVRSGETLENILFTYSLSKDELVENNKHIRNWNKLIPGSKIKIPTITKVIDQDIMEMEPFISEYYPHKNILEKRDEDNIVINLEQDDSKPVSLVDDDVIKPEAMSDFVEKDENNQLESEPTDKSIEESVIINNHENINDNKDTEKHINIDDLKANNRQDQDNNITNKEINTNDKMTEKKEAKPLNKRKVKYYPYYYFNPYYGQYFLYYYPIYE